MSNTEEEGDTSDRVPKVVKNVHVGTDPRRQFASDITSCEPGQDGKTRELFARINKQLIKQTLDHYPKGQERSSNTNTDNSAVNIMG